MILGLMLAIAVGGGSQGEAPAAPRTIIHSAADLPQRPFALDAAPSAAFLDAGFLQQTVPALRSGAEHVLAEDVIEDPKVSCWPRTYQTRSCWLITSNPPYPIPLTLGASCYELSRGEYV